MTDIGKPVSIVCVIDAPSLIAARVAGRPDERQETP